jgi:ankyrin repeat protein
MASPHNSADSSTIVNLFLFNACEQGDLHTLQVHLNSLSSSEISLIRDENKASLLHYASRFGHLNILKYFIETKHIDISQLRTSHSATCAHDAAVCDQMEILKYIFHHNKGNISEKLRWTVRDEQGNTPLHLGKD